MAKNCRVEFPGSEADAVVMERPVSFTVNRAKAGAYSANVLFYVDFACSDHLVNNLASLQCQEAEVTLKKLSKAGLDVLFTGNRGLEKAVMKLNSTVIAESQPLRSAHNLR